MESHQATQSERDSNTTKIETIEMDSVRFENKMSERDSNTTKIETKPGVPVPVCNMSERDSNTTKIETGKLP